MTNFDKIISTVILRSNGDTSDNEIIIMFPSGWVFNNSSNLIEPSSFVKIPVDCKVWNRDINASLMNSLPFKL